MPIPQLQQRMKTPPRRPKVVSKPVPEPQQKVVIKYPWYKSKWAIAAHVVVVYAGVVCYVQYLIKPKQPALPVLDTTQQDQTPSDTKKVTFSDIASEYDKKIDPEEFTLGLGVVRWWLMKKAAGKILEVNCGTGRNSYPKDSEVVLLDSSAEMLQQAQLKLGDAFKSIRLVQGDARDLSQFEDDSFDTVVDTFGLCSIDAEDKEGSEGAFQALNEMARVCKPEGKVLLLEHGKSNHWMTQSSLDNGELNHYHKWGCRWNRNIEKLVEDSNLKVKTFHTWHFGSTKYIVAQP